MPSASRGASGVGVAHAGTHTMAVLLPPRYLPRPFPHHGATPQALNRRQQTAFIDRPTENYPNQQRDSSLPEPSTDSSPTAAEFFGSRRLDSTKIDQCTKMIQSFWRHVLKLWEALPCFHGPHACFFFSIPSIKVLGFSTTECSLNVDP